MKYYFKLWTFKNGQKEKDYTEYLTAPIFYEDRLNEELDTAEVILDSMPIASKFIFPPKTKFRLERFKNEDFSDEPQNYDFVVDHDDIEEYVGRPDICCHRIHLIEPSVIAQGMHVDNIALTYELQDVTLNYKTYKEDSTKLNNLVVINNGGSYAPIKSPNNSSENFKFSEYVGASNYFKNSYFYKWINVESLRGLNLNLANNVEHKVMFEIPSLICQGCLDGANFENLFEMNTITRVWRTETFFNNPSGFERRLILEKENGSIDVSSVNNSAVFSNGNNYYLRKIKSWSNGGNNDNFTNHYETNCSPISYSSNKFTEKVISFNIPALSDTEIENGKGYLFEIECVANPITQNSIIDYYEFICRALKTWHESSISIGTGRWSYSTSGSESKKNILVPSSISVNATFNLTDLSSTAVGGPLLTKGIKYSCYDLLRKALLTTDSQIIDNNVMGLDDIEYCITLDPKWNNRLKTCKVQETIFEEKNLWEVLLQIGYYLHAIPYLYFAEDGTDRFVLSFKQLGDTKTKKNTSKKITIFNSQNLNDFFTQYDSYVTNIFSPQNEVDEWLVCTTNDSGGLISNNTAILKTKYGISEIIDFEITYDGSNGGTVGTKSALRYIFEKSIYQCLTADYKISPSKGDSIYYSLGNNIIEGLNYVAPSQKNDVPMALKRIVGKVFSGVNISNIKFNSLMFHIKYKTQDSMRVSQIRPDIKNFMKNSSYEKYPHHEQFHNQQDKIVDSERFSLNLFGKLVRVGNWICQCQEQVVNDEDEKESGDLVNINGEPYYVTVVENEWYNEALYQKVTYSKNFNQLSQIVTIPSEPRFYEVSETSKIRREKPMFDFFEISTEPSQSNLKPRYLNNQTWKTFIKSLLFNKGNVQHPNYAWTRFLADKKRVHKGSYNQFIPLNQMFPSSELDRTDPNVVMPVSSSDHADTIVPLLHFPLKDGIMFEWDMEDNFKAGDFTDISIEKNSGNVDEAYKAQQAMRYCDVLGRADLFTFRLFNKTDWSYAQSQQLPKACIEPTQEESQAYIENPKAEALDKDCREEISFNYQINLTYKTNDFITFSNLFGTKIGELKCCFLNEEVSMFNENANIIPATVLADNVSYNLIEDNENNQITIEFENILNLDYSKVKSIIFYDVDENNSKISYLAKNFKNGLTKQTKIYIYPIFNEN